MNILIINHYAGSPEYGMEFRPYYMCKEWILRGHQTLIVGGSYSHLRKLQPSKVFESIDGVNYRWVKLNRYKGNGIGRVISIFLFITKLGFLFKKILGGFKPDVVIASSTYPLDIYPAKRIAKYYSAKLIYEVHDLWPLSPIELGGYSPKHPFIRVLQKAEDDCYKYVDAVVCMLPNAEKHMKERGLAAGKFYCVPNGIVLSDWEKPMELPQEHVDFINKLKSQGKTFVGFAGAHGIANSLYAVIDAVALLKEKNIDLVLVGTGPEKENLQKYVEKKNFVNIHFLPPVNKLAVPSLLKEMDILYIGLQKQSLFRFGISPNKLFDYMMAGKPVVQAIEAGNNIVADANCGLCAEPDNIDDIALSIMKLNELSPSEREQLGQNGKSYVLNNHTYGVLAEKFLRVLENI